MPVEKGGVAFINQRENKILMVKEQSGKWGLPKGHREAHDFSIFACALREFTEETGLDLRKLPFKLLGSKKNQGTTIYYINCKKATDTLHIKLDVKEISEYSWQDINSIEHNNRKKYNKTARHFVKHLIKFLS